MTPTPEEERINAFLSKFETPPSLITKRDIEFNMRLWATTYKSVEEKYKDHESLEITLFMIASQYRRLQEDLHKLDALSRSI
jgi:hypothetical protein